ncbi:MAG TPA: hypothetical protein VGE14_16395 [Marmoricola sp.]
MRPLFADAVPAVDGSDRDRDRRAEQYRRWRRTRVVFLRPEADPYRSVPAGDLPRQRTKADP